MTSMSLIELARELVAAQADNAAVQQEMDAVRQKLDAVYQRLLKASQSFRVGASLHDDMWGQTDMVLDVAQVLLAALEDKAPASSEGAGCTGGDCTLGADCPCRQAGEESEKEAT